MRWLGAVLAVLLWAGAAQAAERITDFASRIEVQPDGSVIVSETISVIVEGREIKRGIYRDIPTVLDGGLGSRQTSAIEFLAVRRNGTDEPHHTESIANGIRLYLGRKEKFLDHGPQTYDIRYRMTRQVRFFDDYDEIYWNATGDGWAFPIEHATATVILPDGARPIDRAAYTGERGEQGQDWTATTRDGLPAFETTRSLRPGEGLTVAVSFAKGLVREPTAAENAANLLRDNLGGIIGLIGILLLLAWFLWAWNKVGRDPEGGAIVALYEPPHGLSPAACRFISRYGFDDTCLAAAIVSAAVKGGLKIEEKDALIGKKFELVKVDATKSTLSGGEKAVLKDLFSEGDRIVASSSSRKQFLAAKAALKSYLATEFEAAHFRTNYLYLLPGVAVTVLSLLGIANFAPEPPAVLFMAVWLTGWSFGTGLLVSKAKAAWVSAASQGGLAYLPAIFVSLFALPFVGGWLVGAGFMLSAAGVTGSLAIILLIGLNVLFFFLMKAPTILGQRVMDKIEGFKLYLSVAEQDRLEFAGAPDDSIELFERFLPYAVALGVETAWAARFKGQLEQAAQASGRPYHPLWYGGHHGFSASDVTAAVSGITGALASASSSGSSGGGGAGGGGGGGGGGGW